MERARRTVARTRLSSAFYIVLGRESNLFALVGGVGPHNAARIIGQLRENETDFYRDILAQENRVARPRSFWD
jgi:ATP-dependent Lhr-like helicase